MRPSLYRFWDIIAYFPKVTEVTWQWPRPFQGRLSSVGWDLLCSTHIPNLKCPYAYLQWRNERHELLEQSRWNVYGEYALAPINDLVRFWSHWWEVKVTTCGGEGIHVDAGASKSIFWVLFVPDAWKNYAEVTWDGQRTLWKICFILLFRAESAPEVDRNDQWLGVAVASQATHEGVALVREINPWS